MSAFVSTLLRYRVAVILGLTLLAAAMIVPGFVSLTTLSLGLDRGSTIGLIAIGLTSCCTIPASVPLLVGWLKPDLRAWFGRPPA